MKNQTKVLLMTAVFLLGVPHVASQANAKTIRMDPVQHVFFYGKDAQGASVLLKDLSMEELNALSHGQPGGENYYQSLIDNYPSVQYCEGRGFTVPELVDYVSHSTAAAGGDALSFSAGDRVSFMAMDSYGNFSKSFSWETLYGEDRYYFDTLYGGEQGWNPNWELTTEQNGTLADYRERYQKDDPYYEGKQAVLSQGQKTEVILATESGSGRIGTESQADAKEPGLDGLIRENNGVLDGCLRQRLSSEYALRLCLPMTEADLMYGRRTAYDNMKWICAIELDSGNRFGLQSQGTVQQPEMTFRRQGDQLTVSMSCPTPGVSLYYGRDGSAQTRYNGPFTMDLHGKNPEEDPLVLYGMAVREGYTDAGLQTFSYPAMAPEFQSLHMGTVGRDLSFEPGAETSKEEWALWTSSLEQISVKLPREQTYHPLDQNDYRVDPQTSGIVLSGTLFSDPGSYSFLFQGENFADKRVSVTMKQEAPTPVWDEQSRDPVEITIGDGEYGKGLSVYLLGEGTERTLIPSSGMEKQGEKLRIDGSVFAASKAETYTLEFVNNRYFPATQRLTLHLGKGFSDVAMTAWYQEAVTYVTERGYFSGTGADTFSPNGEMTRGMFTTVLWRMAGQPRPEQAEVFSDVPSDAWYADGIAWAASNGIVGGMGDGIFCPDAPITREQLAVMLCRYANGTKTDADLSRFSDGTSVSPYAVQSMGWAVKRGCFYGDAAGRLMPQKTASRGQVAQILMNFDQTTEESGEL